MNQPINIFTGFTDALRFIALSVQIYGVLDGSLSENCGDSLFLAFFSRVFLRARRWRVVPLWEGDLRVLKKEDGTQIDFLARVRASCLQNNDKFLHVVVLEKVEWQFAADFAALTVATRKLDVSVDDPAKLFETSSTNLPYWGHNFLWPDSERFLIYTDGDNASFIAGEWGEIERLLGISYSYCRERFVSANLAHQTQPDLVDAYVRFCDEFV